MAGRRIIQGNQGHSGSSQAVPGITSVPEKWAGKRHPTDSECKKKSRRWLRYAKSIHPATCNRRHTAANYSASAASQEAPTGLRWQRSATYRPRLDLLCAPFTCRSRTPNPWQRLTDLQQAPRPPQQPAAGPGGSAANPQTLPWPRRLDLGSQPRRSPALKARMRTGARRKSRRTAARSARGADGNCEHGTAPKAMARWHKMVHL